MLKDSVLDYINWLESETYLKRLLDPGYSTELPHTLQTMLRSAIAAEIQAALLLIRDFYLIAPRYGLGSDWEKRFPTSGLLAEIESLVSYPSYAIRRDAIYTLGKICSSESLPVLQRYFDVALERDPLILQPLLSEIGWLSKGKARNLNLERMQAHHHFIVRWAVVEILDSWVGEESERAEKERRLLLLADDSDERVRTSARHCHEKMKAQIASTELPESEAMGLPPFDSGPTVLSYADLDIWFCNYLNKNKILDYTLHDLERFVSEEMPVLEEKRREYLRQHH